MSTKIFTSPATFLALAVIALGLIAWWQRSHLTWVARGFSWLSGWSDTMFGFEPVNRWIAKTVQHGAEALRGTQTGLLQWNIGGILAGLLVLLAVLVVGGVR